MNVFGFGQINYLKPSGPGIYSVDVQTINKFYFSFVSIKARQSSYMVSSLVMRTPESIQKWSCKGFYWLVYYHYIYTKVLNNPFMYIFLLHVQVNMS